MHSAIQHRSSDADSRPKYGKGDRGYRGTGQKGANGLSAKRSREPEMVIIRNKFTKEVVDLEVSYLFMYFCLDHPLFQGPDKEGLTALFPTISLLLSNQTLCCRYSKDSSH